MKFFIGQDSLVDKEISQDDYGNYYMNANGNYWTAKYDDFVKGSPSGYTKNLQGAGSHASDTYGGIIQRALDYPTASWSWILSDMAVKIIEIYGGASDPSGYVRVEFDYDSAWWQVILGHCYTDLALYSIVPAGQTIAKTNGSMGHLHISCQRNHGEYRIHDLLYPNTPATQYKKGDVVELVAPTNIRDSYGLNAKVLATASQSAVCQVLSDAYFADGYEWHEVKFLDQSGWCYTGNFKLTDRNITNIDGSVPDTCEIKLAKANKENEQLKKQVESYKMKLEKINKLSVT